MYDVTGSLVLYKTTKHQLKRVSECFLNTRLNVRLFIIDNFGGYDYGCLLTDRRINYIKTGKNLGYGRAHNIAIRLALDDSSYHLVLTPDIHYKACVMEEIFDFMNGNPRVGHLMPRIIYPDGELQYLCKKLPNPFNLFLRRFISIRYIRDRFDYRLELRFFSYDRVLNAPYLSGCFMFFRMEALRKVGLFDERYFMYPEDIDLTRRIHAKYDTVFYPYATVVHDHAKESYKSYRMLLIHIRNIAKYFNKWGWIIDPERSGFNRRVLQECKNPEKHYVLKTSKNGH